jgi:hypothetical protein
MAITTLTILLALLVDVAALVPLVVALPAVGLVLLHVQAHLVRVRLARALRVITLQVGTTLLPDVAARAY